MITDRDLERLVRTWLAEGSEQLPDVYLDSALEEISTTPQRRPAWPAWRFSEMNPRTRFGVAAVVAALVVIASAAILGHYSPFNVGNQSPSPTAVTGKIAFISGRDVGEGVHQGEHIFVMNADGTHQTLLSKASGSEFWPDISPDGSKVAYSSNRQGAASGATMDQVYVMNIDGTDQVAVTSAPAGVGCSSGVACANWRPAWSPDSKRFAFESYRNATAQIYVANVDGSGLTRLTHDTDDDKTPAWSPDGTKILFVKVIPGGFFSGAIWVMNADGSGQTQLTTSTTDGGPAWSPDGKRIAFDRGGSLSQIFVMNANGTGATQLTTGVGVAYGDPTWSPDGQWIAFGGAKPDADGDIFVIRLDGTGLLNVSNYPGNNYGPSWR